MKTSARAATSKAGQGNPSIVEAYPTTSDEVDVVQMADGVENGELPDAPPGSVPTDWYTSYHGLSAQPFPKEVAEILMAPIEPLDVEVKPGEFINVTPMERYVLSPIYPRWTLVST